MQTYIGIDPGKEGAVAVIYPDNSVELFDTPIDVVKKGKKHKTVYMPALMANLIAAIKDKSNHNCCVYIEEVHAMKGQGVTSCFDFGTGYGLWLGIVAALMIPCIGFTPQRWKKEIMQGISDKEAARLMAHKLFPNYSDKMALKKHHGRAEALLIAEYARRMGF